MRYETLKSTFYIKNREDVINEIEKNSLVLVTSHDEYPRCGDTTFPFRQNSDLFYLCGIDQEETILAMAPWHPNPAYREILFIKNPSPENVIWFGHRLSKEEATKLSGIQTVIFTENFEAVLQDLMVNSIHIYLHIPENSRMKNIFPTQEIRLAEKLKKDYPLHSFRRLAPIIYHMRCVKKAEELKAMKQACNITVKAFNRAIHAVKPEKFEYEIEAELIYEMIKNGATGHSFAPIIASGEDTCILHYIKNDKIMKNEDLLLMDFGAEYANYAGDATRTIPVNGKFTTRQKEVYNAVVAIFKDARKMFIPGMTIFKLQKFVVNRMNEELIKLGLFTKSDLENQDPEKPLYKKYYMHHISHFIGLDTHDVGERDWTFEPGMVLSCEPGIYIAEEKIGVRIETDMVVADHPIDLMEDLPLEVDDIESLMSQNL